MLDDRGVTVLGKVSDAERTRALAEADVLCAPSLGGESFGMVLTEAFAAGTPVVASDIPGYRDVVRDGVDGVLVPRGDATALAETLRELALAPQRRAAMGVAASEHAERYAWPSVAAEVLDAYEDAIAMPAPSSRAERTAVYLGSVAADLAPPVPPRRLPTLEPRTDPVAPGGRAGVNPVRVLARRVAIGAAGLAAAGLALLALQRIGLERIGSSLLASSPTWVIVGLALMCASMVVRGVAWHAILRAALPGVRVKRIDAMQGTFIGVLMSATLPARLGEPSRALIVARRTGRPREHLPTVVGTLVSQTILNIVALVVLGGVMFATSSLFDQRHDALIAFGIAPVAILLGVMVAPALLRGGVPSRSRRVQAWVRRSRDAAMAVRAGLRVFRMPREGATAISAQLLAWAIQWLSCYVLLVALGLDDRAGLGAAAAVLFAVNVTAALPATPSNLGVFQAACVAVLHGAYGVGSADALAYGIVLQAVEIATAVIMGTPALLKEGLSWRDVRMRALHASPVRLDPLPARRRRRPGEGLSASAAKAARWPSGHDGDHCDGRARGLGLPAALRRRVAVLRLDRGRRAPGGRARGGTGQPLHARPGGRSRWRSRCRWPTGRPRGARRRASSGCRAPRSSRWSPRRRRERRRRARDPRRRDHDRRARAGHARPRARADRRARRHARGREPHARAHAVAGRHDAAC